jgi:flagellar motor switch protein FliN/FliY
MDKPLNPEALSRAVADELAAMAGTRLGRALTLEPATAPAGAGSLVTMTISAGAAGRLVIWVDAAAVTALTGVSDGAAGAGALRDVVAELGARIEAKPAWAGLTFGDVSVSGAPAPSPSLVFRMGPGDGSAAFLAVACDVAAAAGDRRLEAVLDVDLPLVVRFGQAMMPLRALADLGPGAVIDMGRSPDEPVELLVGERMIARGEVVIVAGNYGVRITELVSGRGPAELEVRPA